MFLQYDMYGLEHGLEEEQKKKKKIVHRVFIKIGWFVKKIEEKMPKKKNNFLYIFRSFLFFNFSTFFRLWWSTSGPTLIISAAMEQVYKYIIYMTLQKKPGDLFLVLPLILVTFLVHFSHLFRSKRYLNQSKVCLKMLLR